MRAIVLAAASGVVLLGGVVTAAEKGPARPDSVLWYKQAAHPKKWTEALPLGNGRLGVMVFGAVAKERLLLNEDSIWSGWPEPRNDREGAFDALQAMRKLLRRGEHISRRDRRTEKWKLLERFCSEHGYGKKDFGCYQSFCDAWITFGHDPGKVSGYHRSLDLAGGIADVSYALGGVRHRREYLCSHPDQVAAARFSADRPASVAFTLSVSSLHKKVKVTAEDGGLVLRGTVDTGDPAHEGLAFEARFALRLTGGKVEAAREAEHPVLRVTGADEAVLFVAGSSNYASSYPTYRGESPGKRNARVLAKVAGLRWNALRRRHAADHLKLFGRVALDLAGTSRAGLPTDERLRAYKKDRADRGLEALLFQYGRYLLIASSREGGLPANLQGLWNNTNRPPWNCDYHLNINLQMNYWPADSCALSECMRPLVDWSKELAKPGAKTAKVHYNARGWVVHHTSNVWGFTSPGPLRGVHMIEAESGAFLCQNLWDHYAYTGDRDYLAREAWPLLKGAAEFWVDNLQETKDGHLAVSPSYSPEHGPLTDGAYYHTMIVWDLFGQCIEACRVLGRDEAFAKKLAALRSRLQPLKIGRFGQLQEWRDTTLEANANKDKHRHVSHMYAVYPGRQIIPGRDDALTKAATRSMNFRGDGATGWSMGWKINLWARLRDGDRVHKLIGNLIAGRLYANLWDSCPPFQIDGNFGYTAGVAEMLVQSHVTIRGGDLVLLPALPKAWATGSATGLRARGAVVVERMQWKDGELTHATIRSEKGGKITVRCGGKSWEHDTRAGQVVTLKF